MENYITIENFVGDQTNGNYNVIMVSQPFDISDCAYSGSQQIENYI